MKKSRKKPGMKQKEIRQQSLTAEEEKNMIGKKLSFAAAEAYRLLRANIQFALPDEQKCRVIGITSSQSGEGKSTTALNLAYMLAEAEKRILLIEADMRLPTIAGRLAIQKEPGLSNLLARLNGCEEVIQDSGIHENLKVITSGSIPPNPSELLGAERMQMSIEQLSRKFDFIVLDLPPVNAVSDALVVSRLANGMIMVVRQDYTSRGAVADAMRQLQYAEAKILGFVVTRSHILSKSGKYKKYRKYEYGYGDH